MSQKQINGSQPPMTAFGAVIRRRRRALDLSQKKLGERCGLTQEYISGIERGTRNPTLKSIWTLAEGLEASPGKLLLEAEERMGTNWDNT
jgi:transcriptional regulator with XRE-family HTH domain